MASKLGEIRRQLIAECDSKCFYCGKIVIEACPDRNFLATVDHVIPKSKGGSDDKSNLVLACYPCNFKKDYISPEEQEEIRWSKAIEYLKSC